MTHYLRDAVEKMKQHYIRKLLESGLYLTHEKFLYDLTLSELKEEYKKLSLLKTNTK